MEGIQLPSSLAKIDVWLCVQLEPGRHSVTQQLAELEVWLCPEGRETLRRVKQRAPVGNTVADFSLSKLCCCHTAVCHV